VRGKPLVVSNATALVAATRNIVTHTQQLREWIAHPNTANFIRSGLATEMFIAPFARHARLRLFARRKLPKEFKLSFRALDEGNGWARSASTIERKQ
jgi:hypothetical protein